MPFVFPVNLHSKQSNYVFVICFSLLHLLTVIWQFSEGREHLKMNSLMISLSYCPKLKISDMKYLNACMQRPTHESYIHLRTHKYASLHVLIYKL